MLLAFTFIALGVALSFVLHGDVELDTKYQAPIEESFQRLLERRGLN